MSRFLIVFVLVAFSHVTLAESVSIGVWPSSSNQYVKNFSRIMSRAVPDFKLNIVADKSDNEVVKLMSKNPILALFTGPGAIRLDAKLKAQMIAYMNAGGYIIDMGPASSSYITANTLGIAKGITTGTYTRQDPLQIIDPQHPYFTGVPTPILGGDYTHGYKLPNGELEIIASFKNDPVIARIDIGRGGYILFGYSYYKEDANNQKFGAPIFKNVVLSSLRGIERASISLNLSKSTLKIKDKLEIAATFENLSEENSISADYYLWRQDPSEKITNLLSSKLRVNFEPLIKFTDTQIMEVAPNDAKGTYTIGARLVHPVTGATLNEASAKYTVVD